MIERYVILPDVHAEATRIPEPYKHVKQFIEAYKPDEIIILGDFLNMDSISHWNENKRLELEGLRFRKDVERGNEELDFLQKHCKRLVYIEGNHCDWVNQYLDRNPVMVGTMELPVVLHLESRNIQWVPMIKRRKSKYGKLNNMYKVGKMYFIHGHYTGLYHAKKHVEKYGCCICYGHTHMAQTYQITMKMQESIMAWGLGCLCYDDKTEILTTEGWKYFNDLTQNSVIANYNKSLGSIEYHKVEGQQKYPYTGMLHRYVGRRLDLLVTPEHKMLYQTHGNGERIKTSEELFNSVGSYTLRNSCEQVSTEYEDENMLKLIGWIISEGSLEKIGNSHRISIYQKKPRFVKEIQTILKCLNIKYTETVDKRNGVKRFRLSNVASNGLITKFDAGDIKRIPRKLLNLESNQMKTLFATLVNGDGHRSKKGHTYYATANKHLAEDVQELCFKIGLPANIKEGVRNTNYKTGAIIYLINTSTRSQWTKISSKTKEFYNGYVYDVTSTTGFIVVRRNGKITISGNCDHEPEYLRGKPASWLNQFAIMELNTKNGRFSLLPINIVYNKFIFNGKEY